MLEMEFRKRKAVLREGMVADGPSHSQADRGVLDSLLRIVRPQHVYHMDKKEQREELIDQLWTGEFKESCGRFTAANPDLVNLLEQHHRRAVTAIPRREGPRAQARECDQKKARRVCVCA